MAFTFVFILLLSIQTAFGTGSIQPPVWPPVFSESMTVNFKSYNTTGKFWYDYLAGGQRYDFANGQSSNACGFLSKENTPCKLLCSNKFLYFILPEKNLCCYISGLSPFERNWIQVGKFKYEGQEQISNEHFQLWMQHNSQPPVSYYADKSPKRIPRRLSTSPNYTINFWTNTYSEEPIDSTVFNVHPYVLRVAHSSRKTLKTYSKNNEKFVIFFYVKYIHFQILIKYSRYYRETDQGVSQRSL